LKKRGRPETAVPAALAFLQSFVAPIEPDWYGLRESDSRQRLRGRDEGDWPVLAAALELGCAVWTEDTDFFGTGVSVWTTSNIEIFLEAQAKSNQVRED
jgi:predicted nucleic acid-binding protein